MTKSKNTLIFSFCVFNLSVSSVYGANQKCEEIFSAKIKTAEVRALKNIETRLMSFEVETADVNSSSKVTDAELKNESILFFKKAFKIKKPGTVGSLEFTGLKDGNLAVVARGLSLEQVSFLETSLNGNKAYLASLKNHFVMSPNSKLVASLSNLDAKIAFSTKSQAEPISKELSTAGAPGVLLFTGKHAYLPFKLSLAAIRSGWDLRFPSQTWQPVGAESVFGTKIENAQNLRGLQVVGIGIDTMNEGKAIIEKPLENVKIWEFSGTVLEIKDINQKGPDPLWVARIQDKTGNQTEISLTDAIGLRVLRSSNPGNIAISGNEAKSATQRRQKTFEIFKVKYQEQSSPKFKVSLHDNVERQLRELPTEDRLRFENWREHMMTVMNKTDFLKRDSLDHTLRPMKELSQENMRPGVEETHRLLFDTESSNGYTAWLVDFSTQVMLNVHAEGRLTWGNRQVQLRDIHWNYPFAEGKHGIPTMKVELQEVPLASEKDLIQGIDKLALHYGFDRNIAKLPNLKLQSGTKAVGTLEGVSLEESTPFFFEYSRNHVLFLDNYFKGKPHGQYPHIMQWLYLAERYSQPKQNRFGVQMLESLFAVQSYFMDDMVAGVTVTDFVGQRAPQNPDFVNNTLQLFFPVD